jgi:hypothetical protein
VDQDAADFEEHYVVGHEIARVKSFESGKMLKRKGRTVKGEVAPF